MEVYVSKHTSPALTVALLLEIEHILEIYEKFYEYAPLLINEPGNF
jgi:hypothetical protein